LLLLFGVAYIVVNALWIQRNGEFLQFDVVHHLDEVADFENLSRSILAGDDGPLRKSVQLASLLNNRAGDHPMWSRLIYAIGACWAFLAANDEKAPYTSNVLFLGIWVAGAVLVMRRLLRPQDDGEDSLAWEGAAYAVCLGLLLPGTYGPARMYGQYFPMAAMGLVGLWALMATRGFTRVGMSIVFGVVTGLAILVKSVHPFYMAAPLVYALWMIARCEPDDGDDRSTARRIGLLVAAGAVALLLTHLWLAGRWGFIVRELAAHAFPDLLPFPDGHVDPHAEAMPQYSLSWWTYYGRAAVTHLGPAGVAGLTLAIPLLIVRRDRLGHQARHDRRMLYLAAAAVPLVLSFMFSKESRFLFPLYPFWALLMALGLMTLGPLPRRLIAGTLIAVGSATLLLFSFDGARAVRLQTSLWRLLGQEEGTLWVRAPRAESFPGLADDITGVLQSRPGGQPHEIVYLALPQGGAYTDHIADLTKYETYRLKNRLLCVSRRWNTFIDRGVVAPLCGVESVDLRFLHSGSFDEEYPDIDVLAIFLFPAGSEGFDPPYVGQLGFALPDIAYAQTIAEVEEHLPPGFRLVETWDHAAPDRRDPATAFLFMRD